MSNTPDPSISDSWVDLGGPITTTTSPISLSGAVTPTRRLISNNPFGGEHDYLRMLREAQRESNRSSSKVSPISSAFISGKNTPSGSPKETPPNTPNPELDSSFHDELKAVYINHWVKPEDVQHNGLTASDIMWDWSSQPNIPCKEWTFTSVRSRKASSSSSKMSSFNHSKDAAWTNKRKSFFSKQAGFWTVFITNLVSLAMGIGIGIWLTKKGVREDAIIAIAV